MANTKLYLQIIVLLGMNMIHALQIFTDPMESSANWREFVVSGSINWVTNDDECRSSDDDCYVRFIHSKINHINIEQKSI